MSPLNTYCSQSHTWATAQNLSELFVAVHNFIQKAQSEMFSYCMFPFTGKHCGCWMGLTLKKKKELKQATCHGGEHRSLTDT